MGLLPEKCRIFARASEIAASGRLWRVLRVAGFGECCEWQALESAASGVVGVVRVAGFGECWEWRALESAVSGRLWRVLGVAGFGECCEPQGQARIRCEVGAEPGLITCWT